jgi:proteasome alpha subunit
MEQMGYDKGGGFSPDGRLFQVEYAREAVKRGTTVIGIKAQGGVALLADKRLTSRFLESDSVEKIFRLDEHIGVATSGLVADARMLIDKGLTEAQTNKLVYDEPIDVEILTKKICDYMQAFTQYGGLRPFGTGLLIAGVYDHEKYLLGTDPSGAVLGYKVVAIGSGEPIAAEVFEEKYTEDLNLEDAILLGLEALYKVTEGKMSSDSIDIGVVDTETQKFRLLDLSEVGAYIERIKNIKKEEG